MLGKLAAVLNNVSWLAFSFGIFLIPAGNPALVFATLINSRQQDAGGMWKYVTQTLSRVPDLMLMVLTIISAGYYGLFVLYFGIACMLLRCWENLSNRKSPAQIKTYRQLQIWEKIMNQSLKGRLFGVVMFVIPVLQVVAFTVLLSLGPNLAWFEAGFTAAFACDCLMFCMTVVSFAALLLNCTTKWLVGYRRLSMHIKYERKVTKSFRPLRVEFRNNFADRTTALVLQDHCWREIISFDLVAQTK